MNFENNIKQWVLYDNKIKELNESLKSYREKKNTVSTNIFTYVKDENIKNSVIKISDGRLKFTTVKTYNSLTFISTPISEIAVIVDTLRSDGV